MLQNLEDYLLIPESVWPIVDDLPGVMNGDFRRLGDHVVGWFRQETQKIVALAIHLGPPSLALSPTLTTMGMGEIQKEAEQSKSIRRYEAQTEDGSLRWKVTFSVESRDSDQCSAEVQVRQFDRLDRSGTDVYLIWDDQQRQQKTDNRGQAHFSDIPVDALGRIDLLICPPTH